MYFASKTLVNPVPAQGISLFTIFKASYSSPCLSVPFKTIKFNLSCSHPNFLYLWKKEIHVRVSVTDAQQEENHPVALEEEEQGLDANFNWDASEGDGEGRESVGYVEPNDEAKVYVGNLPYSVDSENLARISEEAGVVDVAEFELNDGSTTVSETTISNGNPLKVKEWKVTMFQDEVAASQGIKIRRRPPTGPPLHYVGPFEFRLQNEGNTPRNILEDIVWHKDIEVSQMKEKKPLFVLKKLVDNAPPVRDFIGALKSANSRTGLPGLIAEVKKASPSRGVLREDFNPVQIAKAYEKGGAACLSVLTDEKYFQGSFENLEAIRKSGVQCPLLCKEFVIDAWQIFYARVKGADAILLIAAVLPDLDIKYMIKICKLLGLTALVEVHDEIEMDRVLEIDGIELIGINNRDLGTFKVDITNTKKLLEGERGQRILEKGIIVVGESGLFTPADIAYVQEAGIKAVLVGESIVKQKDPRAGITQLFGEDISS